MVPTQMHVTITAAVVEEAATVTRHKESVLRLTAEYGMAAYYLVPGAILGWFGVRGMVAYSLGPGRDLLRFLLSCGMTAVPLGVVLLLLRHAQKTRTAMRALLGPVTFSFTKTGIVRTPPEGNTANEAWTSYLGFYVGRHAVICPKQGSEAFLLFPIETLSAEQISEIRTLFGQYIPELDQESLRTTARNFR